MNYGSTEEQLPRLELVQELLPYLAMSSEL